MSRPSAGQGGAVQVVPLLLKYWSFVQELARKQPHFTVPSEYELWMQSEAHADQSFVVLSGTIPVGYVLARLDKLGVLFVWQFAVAEDAPTSVALVLLRRLGSMLQSGEADRLCFTMYPNLMRAWARRDLRRVFGHDAVLTAVCDAVGGEVLYEISKSDQRVFGLSDVYELPLFAEFVKVVFSSVPVSPIWARLLAQIQPSCIIEIGAGHGRFTRILLETTAGRVTSLEPNPDFFGALMSNPSLEYSRLERVCGMFPQAVVGRMFDCLVLHQNVMLELLQQRPLDVVAGDLSASTILGGTVLFDYNRGFDPGAPGAVHWVFSGDVSGIGHVEYYLVYDGRLPGGRYTGTLHFEAKGGEAEVNHVVRLEFVHPPLEEVTAGLERMGFRIELVEPANAPTFFPAELVVVKARRV